MSQAADLHGTKVFAAQVLHETGGRKYVDGKVWVQGTIVCTRDEKEVTWYTVDDGTGVLVVKLTAAARQKVMTPGERGTPGSYVLVVGKVKAHSKHGRIILLHAIIDLSAQPDREALWIMQVIEATKAGASTYGLVL